jgi:hypothetical protein
MKRYVDGQVDTSPVVGTSYYHHMINEMCWRDLESGLSYGESRDHCS